MFPSKALRAECGSPDRLVRGGRLPRSYDLARRLNRLDQLGRVLRTDISCSDRNKVTRDRKAASGVAATRLYQVCGWP